MNPPRILVIEDEPAIADTLVYALRTEGFRPEWRTTLKSGLEALGEGDVALVILDIGLPDGSGLDLCRHVRTSMSVPILFLTARSGEIDRVLGLELGADDYVTKPFSPREVTSRVRAILRRTQPMPLSPLPNAAPATSAAAQNGFGSTEPTPPVRMAANGGGERAVAAGNGARDFVVDAECCEIRYAGTRLELTRYEYRLLKTLLSRPGKVYSRDELMTQAWEDPGSSLDRTVDAHIKMLRAKLRAVSPDTDPIQTHRGLGYSLRMA